MEKKSTNPITCDCGSTDIEITCYSPLTRDYTNTTDEDIYARTVHGKCRVCGARPEWREFFASIGYGERIR